MEMLPQEERPILSPEDIPISSFDEALYRYTQFLLEEKAVPEEIKEKFWAFTDKENALSNLTDIDIRNIINHLEIVFNWITMNKSDYNFQFKDEIVLAQLRSKLIIKLKRSREGFERKMQATQIREVHTQDREMPMGLGSKVGGFFSRIFGRK